MILYHVVSAISRSRFHVDNDVVDKLNYYYTAGMLIVFSILTTMKQYVGQPIQCWIPATFTEPMERYTKNYCWVANTYWLPMQPMRSSDDRSEYEIGFYQWVPFVLALQAVLFNIPSVIWWTCNGQAGIPVQSLVHMACEARLSDSTSRSKAIDTVACQLEEALQMQSQLENYSESTSCRRPRGKTVTLLYLAIKFVYLINAVSQLCFLNHLLGNSRTFFYGFYILRDLLNGREWSDSGNFPRVTMCDLEVKVLVKHRRNRVDDAPTIH